MAEGKKKLTEFPVTEKEKNLIKYMRNISFGEIQVFIQEQEPVRVERTTTSTKL
ncbi:MAG: DUF2292 domain-containing protein [Oscillospiraceae bacterium]|jgi:hypothetical protein|nr:DUF2292 domain-containing protein [Oscillospiraceae bacterium]